MAADFATAVGPYRYRYGRERLVFRSSRGSVRHLIPVLANDLGALAVCAGGRLGSVSATGVLYRKRGGLPQQHLGGHSCYWVLAAPLRPLVGITIPPVGCSAARSSRWLWWAFFCPVTWRPIS